MSTPTEIGGYRIERELGRGAMARVYLGRDPRSEALVAIKVLTEVDPYLLARFQREGEVLARLREPGVVGAIRSGQVDAQAYLVLDYCSGPTLEGWLQTRGRLPQDEACAIVARLAQICARVHAEGVIHRDLKPGNVLFDRTGGAVSELRISDFGLARDAGASSSLTASGVILGTPAYMAPEQLRDARAVDARADVWALGVILYELLAGERPFQGSSALQIADTVLTGRFRPLRELLPETPAALEEVLARALAIEPADRYSDAATLALDLEALVDAQPSGGRARPLRFVLAVAAVALLVAVATHAPERQGAGSPAAEPGAPEAPTRPALGPSPPRPAETPAAAETPSAAETLRLQQEALRARRKAWAAPAELEALLRSYEETATTPAARRAWRLERLELYVRRAYYPEALRLGQELLKELDERERGWVWLQLAYTHHRRGEPAALDAWSEAARSPNPAIAATARAQALIYGTNQRALDLDLIEREARLAARLDPELEEARLALATCLDRREDPASRAEALQLVHELRASAPDSLRVGWLAATLERARGDTQAIRAAIAELLPLLGDAGADYQLIVITSPLLSQRGEFAQAVRVLRRTLDDPRAFSLRILLAVSLAKSGQAAEATDALRDALRASCLGTFSLVVQWELERPEQKRGALLSLLLKALELRRPPPEAPFPRDWEARIESLGPAARGPFRAALVRARAGQPWAALRPDLDAARTSAEPEAFLRAALALAAARGEGQAFADYFAQLPAPSLADRVLAARLRANLGSPATAHADLVVLAGDSPRLRLFAKAYDPRARRGLDLDPALIEAWRAEEPESEALHATEARLLSDVDVLYRLLAARSESATGLLELEPLAQRLTVLAIAGLKTKTPSSFLREVLRAAAQVEDPGCLLAYEATALLFTMGQREAAVRSLTALVQRSADHAEAQRLFAVGRAIEGDRPGVLAALRRALELDPAGGLNPDELKEVLKRLPALGPEIEALLAKNRAAGGPGLRDW